MLIPTVDASEDMIGESGVLPGQNWELETWAIIKTSLLAVRLISPFSDFVSGVLSGIIQKELKIS